MAEEAGVPSTRGLIETDIGPLRRFTGRLDSMPTEVKVYKKNQDDPDEVGKSSTRVSLNCADIEVKEAVEPYHFPTFTIMVTQSNRKKSRWGVLSEGTTHDHTLGFNNVADQQYSTEQLDPSNANFLKASDRMNIKDAIGKRIGFVVCDGVDGRPMSPDLYDGRANADVPTPAWTIYELEGIGVAGGQGVSAMDLAMALLDGKTVAEFNKAALDNPIIRADTSLLQSIGMPPTAPASFVNTMKTAGKFTQDTEGILHKV